MFGQSTFGQKPTGGFGFNQTAQPIQQGFGQPITTAFGVQQTAQTVQQPAFGAQQQQGFGQVQQGFGQQPAMGQVQSAFGQPQTFGSPTTFNQQPQQAFGQPQAAAFGQQPFGQTQQVAFGQTNTNFGTNAFGQQPAFGAMQQQQQFSNFNKPQTTYGQPGYGQQQDNTIPITSVPTCVAANSNFYVAGLASGELKIIQKNPQANNSTNVGNPIISIDILNDEVILGTTTGVMIVHLLSGQSKKLTSYIYPVPCVKYINKDYALASFLQIDSQGNPVKQKPKSDNQTTQSRWATPAQPIQNQEAMTYEVQVLDLSSSLPIAQTKGLPCSGLFTISKETSQSYSSYNSQQSLCKVFVPCIYNYDSNAINVFILKKQSNTIRVESSSSVSFPSNCTSSGISAIAANTQGTKAMIAYECGDLAVLSVGASTSSYSYHKSASNSSYLQKVNCRINSLSFNIGTSEFIAGLQTGAFCTIKDDGSPVYIKQYQDEVSAITSFEKEIILGTGSIQKVLENKTGSLVSFIYNEVNGKIQ
ncbi:hypothetical protein SS50377_22460 [Spironucleus salmonicida]|uniref:Uncharacterized protein n=1 Tax=Spironucleus salmonicida TaxID=348837 RepID=V6LMV5_9EUKA|nr:hypothetical protein SS50377_22460 [Spironucleus salmonicida]|eukprot:EST42049.1 hypothetical protein SS50377_18356 [Spironucleus salmonicida]